MIKIITDSSADLPKEIVEKYDITVVPMTISMNNEHYLEGIDFTPQEFFNKMFGSDELPKTSQPSPALFAEVFSKFDENTEYLCLTISSGLSGTFQSANLGKEISNTNVMVFDTLGGSLAHGFQVVRAAKLAEEGLTMNEIVQELTKNREKMNIIILLNTLENLVKGGRLNKFTGTLAKFLNIKVILEGNKGKVEIVEKVRGTKKFQKRAIEVIRERKTDFSDTVFGITHTGNLENVESIKSELQQLNPKDIVVQYMGATMGTYAGKGGIIISF